MKIGTHCLPGIALAITCAALPTAPLAAPMQAKAPAKPAADRQVERGRYLVMIAGCNDCHTPNFMVSGGSTPEQERLTGSTMGWRGPWGTTYPVNLRLYFQGMSEEMWVNVAKEIQRRPPMPYFALNAMSQADVRAIYRYIRHLGPAGKPAPAFVPPDKDPSTPYVQFPSQ